MRWLFSAVFFCLVLVGCPVDTVPGPVITGSTDVQGGDTQDTSDSSTDGFNIGINDNGKQDADAAQLLPAGKECTADADCQSGFCVTGTNQSLCVDNGADGCPDPEKFDRTQVFLEGAGSVYLCIPKGFCADVDPCTEDDFVDGKCTHDKLLEPSCQPCQAAADCNDDNPCTDDACVNNQCKPVELAGCKPCDGVADCYDGDPCTSDMCYQGKCVWDAKVGGDCCTVNLDCDDNNVCTTDTCDIETGCQHDAILGITPCDDGNPCTTLDQCANQKCLGAEIGCDDGDPCTDDSCLQENGGGCAHTPIPNCGGCTGNVECQDDNPCNGTESCVAGQCLPGTPLQCDDGDPCTVDSCNAVLGCIYQDVDQCCTFNEECDDGNQCTTDLCVPQLSDPTVKSCHNVKDVGTSCDDGDPCTSSDECKLSGLCMGTFDSGGCDDGNPCTEDTCSWKTSDPSVNTCSYNNAPDGTSCGSGKTCQSGECVGGPVLGYQTIEWPAGYKVEGVIGAPLVPKGGNMHPGTAKWGEILPSGGKVTWPDSECFLGNGLKGKDFVPAGVKEPDKVNAWCGPGFDDLDKVKAAGIKVGNVPCAVVCHPNQSPNLLCGKACVGNL